MHIISRLVSWYGHIIVQNKGKTSVGDTQRQPVCGIKLWYFHLCSYPDLRQQSKE